MSEEKKNIIRIDFSIIFNKLWSKKMLFVKVWIITFILSCIWIFPQPRYYTSTVSIAPESNESKNLGGLAAMASNLGFNLGGNSSDAIYPQLYPDLFKSTNFLVSLFDIQIQTKNGKIKTDYYTYMKDMQKDNPILYPLHYVQNWIQSLTTPKETPIKGRFGKRFDPFNLTTETTDILKRVQNNINCTYSRVTEVVTITVKDQDPLVCALMADSIMEHLQIFITDYRTKKARIDYEHYKELTTEARKSYDRARQKYATYSDANEDAVLQSIRSKIEDLENEMQLKYNIYTALNTRLEASMAKVQETTPAFTTLQNATVPVKPAGPKRVIFVLAMLFVVTLSTTAYIIRKELKEWF